MRSHSRTVVNRTHYLTNHKSQITNHKSYIVHRTSQIYSPTMSINRSAFVEVASPGFNL